ncbi:hypothetical protein CK203_033589 [Vitis vinifera]|uniref:Uncharacterized protein n=1 Tax=Vitis vinifera TaxID=29760 RepID=A0A438FL70_VITVI|nr:hypothetical protein CK203_033589 [Vitis vinifera]
MEHRSVSPHVLVFPFPIQGHVNSMLKLAELLSLAGLRITFLNSYYTHSPPPPLHQHSGQIHALCWLSFPNDIRWAAVGSSANRCPIEGYV